MRAQTVIILIDIQLRQDEAFFPCDKALYSRNMILDIEFLRVPYKINSNISYSLPNISERNVFLFS